MGKISSADFYAKVGKSIEAFPTSSHLKKITEETNLSPLEKILHNAEILKGLSEEDRKKFLERYQNALLKNSTDIFEECLCCINETPQWCTEHIENRIIKLTLLDIRFQLLGEVRNIIINHSIKKPDFLRAMHFRMKETLFREGKKEGASSDITNNVFRVLKEKDTKTL
jgi:hypothetical protein